MLTTTDAPPPVLPLLPPALTHAPAATTAVEDKRVEFDSATHVLRSDSFSTDMERSLASARWASARCLLSSASTSASSAARVVAAASAMAARRTACSARSRASCDWPARESLELALTSGRDDEDKAGFSDLHADAVNIFLRSSPSIVKKKHRDDGWVHQM